MLIYGSRSGETNYIFNRARLGELLYYATWMKSSVVQLLSTEKSFIVAQPNNQQRMDWISKIDEAGLSISRGPQVNKGSSSVDA